MTEDIFETAFSCVRTAIALFKLQLPNDEPFLNQTMAYDPYVYEFIILTFGKEEENDNS